MKRNTLYTVNRANQPAFMYRESRNLFDLGGVTTAGADVLGSFINNMGNKTPNFGSIASSVGSVAGGAGGIGGALKGAMGAMGGMSGIASAVGGAVGNLIGGGYSSGVGNVMGSLGKVASVIPGPYGAAISAGLQVLGGGVNRLFGSKVDAVRLGKANEEMNKLNSFTSNAKSLDDIKSREATASVAGIYQGGVWNSSAKKQQEELEEQMRDARQFADRSIGNNVNNLVSDMANEALANYSAYGGPLGDSFGGALGLMQQNKYIDAINNRSNAITKGLEAMAQQQPTTFTNRFDAGGFVNNFMQDPVAAAMNYIQQRDAEEAQAEAMAAQKAREAEFNNLQTRLMNAETQNQGLQALLEDQGRSIATLQEAQALQNAAAAQSQAVPTVEVGEPEPAEVLPTPSRAVRRSKGNNKTWNYIEWQLRKSGKFNDVQIEGIKYNLQRESALNPNAVGDGGKAFGLGQWHGSRQPKDRSLAGQTQHLIDTLSKFDGTSHWIGKGNYQGFMNARTPEEAHYYITKGYERPAARILSKVKRDSDMSLRNLRAFGGELGTNGTDFTNGLLQVNAGNTHERNPFGGVPMGLDSQGIPNLVEEGETVFNDYVFSKRLKVPNFMLKDLGLPEMKSHGRRHRITFADASKKLAEESEKRPNDPISMNGLQASLSKLMEIQEAERMKERAKLQNREMEGLEFACGGKIGNKYSGKENHSSKMDNSSNHDYGEKADAKKSINNNPFEWTFTPYGNLKSEEIPVPGGTTPLPQAGAGTVDNDALRSIAQEENDRRFYGLNGYNRNSKNTEDYDPYPTWMRYAPAVGAGIFTLTDALGLTNKPDYGYASKLEAAANRAAYAPNIKAPAIGDYMRYTPFDRLFYANQMQANARATDRALMNTSGGNRGTAQAAMLANGYNTNNNLGNLYRQAEEYNRAQYERTKEFNRRTNMFNAQMGLEADMANARYRQQAAQMGLHGLAQAANMREAIDARTGAARSANITNLLNSLGNIGRENFALNQINSDRSNRFGERANGTTYYKGTGKAKGGKIQRRKK